MTIFIPQFIKKSTFHCHKQCIEIECQQQPLTLSKHWSKQNTGLEIEKYDYI